MKFECPSKTQAIFLEKLNKRPNDSGLCEAPTGSGKTLAYILAAKRAINPDKKTPQVFVLAHTQNLCIQIVEEFKRVLGDFGINASLCLALDSGYKLDNKAQVIIGTLHSFEATFLPKTVRGTKKAALHSPSDVKLLIVDEADYFFTDAHLNDIMKKLFRGLNQNVQKLLFSATIDRDVRKDMIE